MIVIEGTVEEIIYANDVNGYTVCSIKTDEDTVTAVGYLPFINIGELLRVTGKWTVHPDYGQQLKVEMYEKLMPQTVDAIELYLASGIIRGIGPATASKFVDKFGEETLNIIQYSPERLSEIKGISLNKALKIGQAFDEQRELRRVVMFLQEYGISATYAIKIYKQLGNRAIEEIKENPYRLADEVFGIGFKTADSIARNMGIDMNSRYRAASGIKYILSQAASNGHTYLPAGKLRGYAGDLLEVNPESVDDALISLCVSKSVCIENGQDKESRPNVESRPDAENRSNTESHSDTIGDDRRVYLSAYYNAETGVCRRIFDLSSIQFDWNASDFQERLHSIQVEQGIILAEQQKKAIEAALSQGVLVITGGPGTGKTTVIRSIIKLLELDGYSYALAAPTGRAAKRMAEATAREAKTIHRLLEVGYVGENDEELTFQKCESDTLDTDVIIIDEASMIDILLMNHLLKAIRCGTRLILAGDVDQLPPVRAGNVLKDIINSNIVPMVKLADIFRQARESMIIVNAHRINAGEYPHLNVKDKDFYLVSRRSSEDIVKTLVDLCSRRLPDKYGYDALKDIQVLTPVKKGPAGVFNLNAELQKALNPHHPSKGEKVYGGYTFREGDRVMQVKNNYELRWEKHGTAYDGAGVFNGDMGVIHSIDEERECVTVRMDDDRVIDYDFSILDELEPAYAVTVHKSQGSEFTVVVMPVFPGPQVLMTRNLLYTAITRARNLVILIGKESTLYEMIENDKEALRYSGLADKLKNWMAGQLSY